MTLFTPLIKKVTYKRIPIYINTSFRTVLQCFEILGDSLFSDAEKIIFCLELLIKFKPILHIFSKEDKMQLFEIIFKKFVDIGDKKNNSKKCVDFKQDAAFIYAAFRQCYGIDLFSCKRLHWWKFIALFNGLSADTRIMQIIDIRQRPIPAPTKYNAEERAALIRLKTEYQLEMTQEEREEQFADNLFDLFETLKNMAEKR